LHIVGNFLQRDPLQLLVLGNNFATVVPGPSGSITVSQVTRGTIAQVRKGDYAFLMPLELTPKGLTVSQFVLYKAIPLRQFDPKAPAAPAAR
jgi:hypothetical protein